MSSADGSAAERRVRARLAAGGLDGLPASDLRTLLLAEARERAARLSPADVLRRWRQDRFVRPAQSDPRRVAALEARLWAALPAEVDGVELSPVAPLGTCSAVAGVGQDRIVSTMRSTEVLSDSTNALAVEAADRRLRSPGGGAVHLAASHRLLRAQRFGPGLAAHFRLFTLVSSARDTGSGRTQGELLILHLGYWRQILGAAGAAKLHFTVFDSPVVRDRINDTVRPVVPLVEEPDRERGRGYYVDAALRITVGDVELGDGGFTSWTARLMGNAKERCLVSCLNTERLAELES